MQISFSRRIPGDSQTALPKEFRRERAQVTGGRVLEPGKPGEVKTALTLHERDSDGQQGRVSFPSSEDPAQRSKEASAQPGEEICEVGQNPGDCNGDVESPGLHSCSLFSLRA